MIETQEKPKEKWFFKTRSVVMAFLILGPLALPLLWSHPRYRRSTKVFWTLIVIGLTVIMGKATVSALESIKIYYDQIFSTGGLNG